MASQHTFNPDNALYFEERSETITEEEMAMDQLNAQVCMQIKRGRCYQLCIHNGKQHYLDHDNDFMMYPQVFEVRRWEWLGWLSFFVSKSTNLISVDISDGEHGKMNQRRIGSFIDALVKNCSIQKLIVNADIGSTNFVKLNTLFQNNKNLKGITFQCMNTIRSYSANTIANLCLCRPGTSLRGISIENSTTNKSFPLITRSLSSATELEELSFSYNNLDAKSCAALGRALSDCPEPKLKRFIMSENTISTGSLLPLMRALKKCQQLKELHIDEPLETIDIVSLSTLLKSEHCKLERLRIAVESVYIPVDIKGELLREALTQQQHLLNLNLDDCYLGDTAIRIMSVAITHLGRLKILSLRSNNINNSAANIIMPANSIEVIHLDYNLIGDQALALMARALPIRLKQLSLAGNRISAPGVTHLWELLQRRDHLHCLDLSMNPIGDRGIATLAGFLRGNTTLKYLYIGGDITITETGWQALESTLCDSTSLTTIEASNHKLQGYFTSSGNSWTQRKLLDYFQMNKQGSKRAIVWKVTYCFSPHLFSEDIINFQVKIEMHDKAINYLIQQHSFHTMLTTVELIQRSRLTTIFEYVKSCHYY